MVEPAAPRFSVALPDTWYQLDLDPRTRTDSIAALVADRLGPVATTAGLALRRELTATLRQYARQAASHATRYAALMYQEVSGVPVAASLLIAVGTAGEVQGGTPFETPAGTAYRLRADSAGSMDVQYVLGVPGTALALVLSFATPNVALARPLGELFDAIARSLDWERSG